MDDHTFAPGPSFAKARRAQIVDLNPKPKWSVVYNAHQSLVKVFGKPASTRSFRLSGTGGPAVSPSAARLLPASRLSAVIANLRLACVGWLERARHLLKLSCTQQLRRMRWQQNT